MNRRRFLMMAAAAGATAALAGCGDGVLSGVQNNNDGGNGVVIPPPTTKITAKVGDYPELATTDTWVRLTDTGIAVKRTAAGPFLALSMFCTHEGCLTVILSNRFECGCHGSKFDTNGDVTVGPATSPLVQLQSSYDAATDILTIN